MSQSSLASVFRWCCVLGVVVVRYCTVRVYTRVLSDCTVHRRTVTHRALEHKTRQAGLC